MLRVVRIKGFLSFIYKCPRQLRSIWLDETWSCGCVMIAKCLCFGLFVNPNPLAILAKNLPESAKIQHHAQTLLLDWNWDTRPHAKYPCLGYTVLSPSKSNKSCCWSLNGLAWFRLMTVSENVLFHQNIVIFLEKVKSNAVFVKIIVRSMVLQ